MALTNREVETAMAVVVGSPPCAWIVSSAKEKEKEKEKKLPYRRSREFMIYSSAGS